MSDIELPEATVRLGELVQRVQSGEAFVITVAGRAAARLVACDSPSRERTTGAVERMRALRAGLTLGGLDVRSLIDSGRR